jgi:hypothetical protein
MNTHFAFPHRVHWGPGQIAEAVPLRLYGLFAPGAWPGGAPPATGAPSRDPPRRVWRHAYARPHALPALVRVRS